jgi:hypothetical protein
MKRQVVGLTRWCFMHWIWLVTLKVPWQDQVTHPTTWLNRPVANHKQSYCSRQHENTTGM